MISAGLLASRLFIEAHRRSLKLQTALESRGYHDQLRVLPSTYEKNHTVLLSGVIVVANLFLVWMVL